MTLLLFLFWLLLNGRVTIEIVLIGAVISAALTFAARKILHISPRKELLFWRKLPGIFLYLVFLIYNIIASNFQVIATILKGDMDSPKLMWYKPNIKGESAHLALANSITLTPGTVTVSLGEGEICVYVLRPRMAEGLDDSCFTCRLRKLEETDNG